MVDEGYAATQIINQLHEAIIEEELNDNQKSAVTEKMAVGVSKGHNLHCGNNILSIML